MSISHTIPREGMHLWRASPRLRLRILHIVLCRYVLYVCASRVKLISSVAPLSTARRNAALQKGKPWAVPSVLLNTQLVREPERDRCTERGSTGNPYLVEPVSDISITQTRGFLDQLFRRIFGPPGASARARKTRDAMDVDAPEELRGSALLFENQLKAMEQLTLDEDGANPNENDNAMDDWRIGWKAWLSTTTFGETSILNTALN